MAKSKSGNAGLPQDKHTQVNQGQMGHTSNMKYSSEFGNPQDLSKSTAALASYAKKNKMKY